MGRYIKVANARKSELKKKKSVESVINSVYVRFRSQTQDSDISEIRFRSIFEEFGYVEDVSLKIVRTHKNYCIKHEYVFIHYEASKEGTYSAMTALANLSNVLYDDLHLICEPSKNLLKQIDLHYHELSPYFYSFFINDPQVL